jgi:ketosteroid isomerase-like protein
MRLGDGYPSRIAKNTRPVGDTRRAMAADNVNTFRWALQQLFGARRIRPELLADDVEWVNPRDAVEPGTRRGPEGFNGAIDSVFATWDDVRFDTERVIDNGDDVVALGVLRGHVHAAGMEIDSPHGQIWTFRDSRVVRMQWFNTHRETLDAAGLRE